MVVSELSKADLPTLRGNPFDSRPIERNRANEIVGREDILIRWKEHMHSQSPRLILLTGERGSGRTSLINAISSQTNDRFVGTYWHSDDPLNCALDEIAITFCGHDIPPSIHQKVERIVETLDTASGPLPLVALDYPSHVDISSFLSLILPILQRLRALIVVSVSNSQMVSLDENNREVFDEMATVEPFSQDQIQLLSDLRIRRMSPERWIIKKDFLEAIISRTGGNARSVISILRDLVDEGRGLGSKGTLESLKSWDKPKKPNLPDVTTNKPIIEPIPDPIHIPDIEFAEEIEAIRLEEEEQESEIVEQHFEDVEWKLQTDEIWPDEKSNDSKAMDEGPAEEIPREPVVENPDTITGWAADDGTILSMEEGTEPLPRSQSGGFSGLVSRSRITNDLMPTGPDYSTPIQEPEIMDLRSSASVEPIQEEKPQFIEEIQKSVTTESSPIEEKQVFFSEGELWTVDSELEETLPETSDEVDFDPMEPFHEPEHVESPIQEVAKPPLEAPIIIHSPKWEYKEMIDQKHLERLSDAESLVVTIASTREISPSDAEIQARLEVGRPRLSQIYNSLHKSGILAVRKEGRSRLFKLSEDVEDLLRGG